MCVRDQADVVFKHTDTQTHTHTLANTQVAALCGSLSAQQRGAALARFNAGAVSVLVTSDAFALGLDYPGLPVVAQIMAAAPTKALYVARCAHARAGGRHAHRMPPAREHAGGLLRVPCSACAWMVWVHGMRMHTYSVRQAVAHG
jgi:superfamily II DNA/RNA helicase